MKKFKSLICIFLSIAIVILTTGCGISEDSSNMSSVGYSSDTCESTYGYSNTVIDPNLIESTADVINILLIGQDRRSGDAPRLRSDCCMIVSLNQTAKKVSLISLMRDQYVKDPRYDPDNPQEGIEEYFPINYSYLCGDKSNIFGLIDETIEYNYGISIDYNMEVDFFRFVDVFNNICPINVELSQEEADYLNSSVMAKKHASQVGADNSTWNLKAGVNQLNAAQLLTYCRTRYIPYGSEVQDFGRTNRQRNVVQTVYDHLRSKNLDEIFELISEVKQYISTDMSLEQMGSIAYKLWNEGFYQRFNSYRIPVDGTYQQTIINSDVYGSGADLHLITIDAAKNAEYMHEYIYGDIKNNNVDKSSE